MPDTYRLGTGSFSNTTVCTANTSCWACQPGAYPVSWQQNFCSGYTAPAPVVNTETQFLSCQSGYTGSITQTRTITNGVAGPWTTTSDTCQAIVTTETQVLPCQSGYTGGITQTRTVTAGVPGYWTTTANSCQPIVTTETQVLSCPVHYSGGITQQRTVTAYVAGPWVTVSNTCKQDPPTCFVSTQTQTLSCQTGYVGSIMQSQTSTCPDPYGSQVWLGNWITTANTCVKSVTNPTNISSPISPISPVNPTSAVSSPAGATTNTVTASSIPSANPVAAAISGSASETITMTTTSTPTETSSSSTSSGGSTAPTATSSATSTSAPTPSVKTSTTAATTKNEKIALVVKTITTLDIIEKNSIKQYDVFPVIPFSLNIPDDVLKYQMLGMELIQLNTPTIIQDVQKLKENSLEIEQ